MFKFQIERTVVIEGCPVSGLAAVDFRRANGLPDATDNEVVIAADITSESLVRALAAVGVDVDGGGDIDRRKTYSGGLSWYRRSQWGRPGHINECTYSVSAPSSLLMRILNRTTDEDYLAAIVELMAIHVADRQKAIAAWDVAEAAHAEDVAREKAEQASKAEALVAARLLLAKELAFGEKRKEAVSTLSHFLANVPVDALKGTLKAMTADSQGESIESLKARVEAASDEWLFSNRDDEEPDDDDDDESDE